MIWATDVPDARKQSCLEFNFMRDSGRGDAIWIDLTPDNHNSFVDQAKNLNG
jgi:hypothetical protein